VDGIVFVEMERFDVMLSDGIIGVASSLSVVASNPQARLE
jgi:hypothetical protein